MRNKRDPAYIVHEESTFPKLNDFEKEEILSSDLFDMLVMAAPLGYRPDISLFLKRFRCGLSMTKGTDVGRNKFRSRNPLSSWRDHFRLDNTTIDIPLECARFKFKYTKKRNRG